jgi:glycosyltransferase involved in cell wall biosynthesis
LLSRLIDRERFDFRVCTFWQHGASARAVEKAGIRVDVLGVDPAVRNARATSELAAYLRRVRPNVVHSTIGEANFHNALTAKLSGVQATIIEESGVPRRSLGPRLVHAALYRRVDAIVAVSKAAQRYLLEREYAPVDKLRLIYNCARPEFFQPHERRPAEGRFTFLTAGRLVEVKNHERFLKAFQRVVARHPQARFRIAGEGPLRDDTERWARELGIADNVELLGFRSDVLELLLEADAFVLPSLSEGCSVALAEAMALATPVIGSKVGGIPEVMGELGSEWLPGSEDVDGWAEALTQMIELPESERRNLGERARATARMFAPETNVKAVQGLYDELLA